MPDSLAKDCHKRTARAIQQDPVPKTEGRRFVLWQCAPVSLHLEGQGRRIGSSTLVAINTFKTSFSFRRPCQNNSKEKGRGRWLIKLITCCSGKMTGAQTPKTQGTAVLVYNPSTWVVRGRQRQENSWIRQPGIHCSQQSTHTIHEHPHTYANRIKGPKCTSPLKSCVPV